MRIDPTVINSSILQFNLIYFIFMLGNYSDLHPTKFIILLLL